jgi:hypothetical protein
MGVKLLSWNRIVSIRIRITGTIYLKCLYNERFDDFISI